MNDLPASAAGPIAAEAGLARRIGSRSIGFAPLVAGIGLLLLAEVAARGGWGPAFLVAPSRVWAALSAMLANGTLFGHVGDSLWRTFAGLLIGFFTGTACGLLAGRLRLFAGAIDPIVSFTYPVPKIAILPVLMAWLGLGHASKIAIIALAVFFPAYLGAQHGAQQVDNTLVLAARNMGAGALRVFMRVVVPSALPSIFAALRVSAALAFIVLFASEMIGGRTGLGYLIVFAEANLRFDIMYAAIACIAVLGFITDRVVVRLRRRLLRGQMIGREEALH